MAMLCSPRMLSRGRRMNRFCGQCARGGGRLTVAALLAALIATAGCASANQPPATNLAAPVEPANTINNPMAVPGFWDPRRRPERPDLSRISIIRFLTETDYPPFDYAGPDGTPAGFNVDLARLICEEIKVACTVQMRRFDTLVASLNSNNGDAVIASIAETPEMRRQVDFSDPYYRTPARFVSRRDFNSDDVRPEALEGKKIAVVAGTAHEAYLKTWFTEAELHPYPNEDAARFALKKGDVDLLFGDGISLAFWLNGTDSGGCCEFRGGRSTGRCSSCGRKAVLPICGYAISPSARTDLQI